MPIRPLLVLVMATALLGGADAQESRYRRLVGTWHGFEGQEDVEIRPDGDVYWSGGPRLRVAPTTEGGANFAFAGTLQESGKPVSCLYYVDFLRGKVADWKRVGRATFGCPPKGRYELQDGPAVTSGAEGGLVYYRRDADRGRVEKALGAAGIAFAVKESSLPEPVNQVTCSPDAAPEDVKSLVRTLVDAGVGIRRVKPRQGDVGHSTVGSDVAAEGRAVLDRGAIDAMEGCVETAGKVVVPLHPRVSIELECVAASGGADVWFYLYDEVLDRKTKVYNVDVDYHTRRLVNASVNYLPESKDPWVYYYAKGKNFLGIATAMPSDGRQPYDLPTGERVRFGRARLRQGVMLDCN